MRLRAGVLVNITATAITIAATAYNIYFAYSADKREDRRSELEEQVAVREAQTASRDYSLKVTDAVISSLEKRDNTKQIVAVALIETLDDGSLKNSLRAAVQSIGSPAAQQNLAVTVFRERTFKAEQRRKPYQAAPVAPNVTATTAPPSNAPEDPLQGIRLTIYYCDRVPGQENAARQIADGFAVAPRRFIALPKSVNAKPKFQIYDNIMFHNVADSEAATFLNNDITGTLDIGFIVKSKPLPVGEIELYFCGITFAEQWPDL